LVGLELAVMIHDIELLVTTEHPLDEVVSTLLNAYKRFNPTPELIQNEFFAVKKSWDFLKLKYERLR
jgi:hypothetical protein